MIDVSDGLAKDLSRLASASGLDARLDAVPLHRDARRAAKASARTALEHALFDGEDHELVASLPEAAARRWLSEWPAGRRLGRLAKRSKSARSQIFLPSADGSSVALESVGGYVHGS